jgi:hypothetical protein
MCLLHIHCRWTTTADKYFIAFLVMQRGAVILPSIGQNYFHSFQKQFCNNINHISKNHFSWCNVCVIMSGFILCSPPSSLSDYWSLSYNMTVFPEICYLLLWFCYHEMSTEASQQKVQWQSIYQCETEQHNTNTVELGYNVIKGT